MEYRARVVDVPLPAPHSCRNCEDIDPESCLFNRPCEHPNAEYLGSISGAGQPKTKRFHCPECDERYQVQEEPPKCRWPSCLTKEQQGELAKEVTRQMLGEEPSPPPPDQRLVCGCVEPETACAHCGGAHPWDACAAYEEAVKADVPPQPERRPPYAVAYSAGGHAYEVLLPGDARAEAVDGRLIIEHPGLQVLGITRVQPVRTENSDG
jgi:hypothetical protein